MEAPSPPLAKTTPSNSGPKMDKNSTPYPDITTGSGVSSSVPMETPSLPPVQTKLSNSGPKMDKNLAHYPDITIGC